MNIKGSKTEQNLWTAFSGESQARNKYMFFAQMAKQEGYIEIADVFEKTATHEEEHAKTIFSFLNGIGNTIANLNMSAQSENYEWTTMYEEYEKVALAEGFTEVADFFKKVAIIEREHEEKYLQLLQELTKY